MKSNTLDIIVKIYTLDISRFNATIFQFKCVSPVPFVESNFILRHALRALREIT